MIALRSRLPSGLHSTQGRAGAILEGRALLAGRDQGEGGARNKVGTTRSMVHVDIVWWQVGCSGHAPQQTVEFAPPPPLATAGRADGVSRLTNQVRRRPTTGRSPHSPRPPVPRHLVPQGGAGHICSWYSPAHSATRSQQGNECLCSPFQPLTTDTGIRLCCRCCCCCQP